MNLINLTLLSPSLLISTLTKRATAFLGRLVSKIIVPGQNYKPRKASFYDPQDGDHFLIPHHSSQSKEIIFLKKALNINLIAVPTPDKVHLDTIEFEPNAFSTLPSQQKKYLIHFLARGDCHDQDDNLLEMMRNARDLQCQVIGFNHRGVRRSTKGKLDSAEDLITDGVAQVQRLIDNGANPNTIYLTGISLGAALATLVANHFFDRGILIHHYNANSFSSLTNFLVGHVRTIGCFKNGHQESMMGKTLGYLVKPPLKYALLISGWEMDAGSAFKQLPASHKEYRVLRSAKADRYTWGAWVIDDPVITNYASLHADLMSVTRQAITTIQSEIQKLTEAGLTLKQYQQMAFISNTSTEVILATNEHFLNIKQLQAKVEEIKAQTRKRKMVSKEEFIKSEGYLNDGQMTIQQKTTIEYRRLIPRSNLHQTEAENLKDLYYGKSAREHFIRFFQGGPAQFNTLTSETLTEKKGLEDRSPG